MHRTRRQPQGRRPASLPQSKWQDPGASSATPSEAQQVTTGPYLKSTGTGHVPAIWGNAVHLQPFRSQVSCRRQGEPVSGFLSCRLFGLSKLSHHGRGGGDEWEAGPPLAGDGRGYPAIAIAIHPRVIPLGATQPTA